MAKLNHQNTFDTRGQLILVTGFALAFTLVALVLLLNTAIYTENLASRGVDRSLEEAVEFRESSREGLGGIILAFDDEPYSTVDADLEATVANFSKMLQANYLDRGTITSIRETPTNTENGVRIYQTNDTIDYSAAVPQPDQNWTVAENITQIRDVRFTFNTSTPLNGGFQDAFRLTLQNSSNTSDSWSVYFTRNSDQIEVFTGSDGSPNLAEDCTVSYQGDIVSVDITGGTVGNQTCSILTMWDGDPPDEYRLRFYNAFEAHGTFNMTLLDPVSLNTTRFATDPSEGPSWVSDVLYSATFSIEYESPSLSYSTNITVAPGEPDYA